MSDRIHVTMELELLVDDAGAMREAAFERLQSAWSGDDDFPYESAADVPLDEVVHSLLADALPAGLPGCRRSQLKLEAEDRSGDGGDTSSRDDSDAANGSDAADSDESERDDDGSDGSDDSEGSDAEPRSTRDEANDSEGSAADDEKPAPERGSTDESSQQEDQADTSKDDDSHGAP